jgi:hypothetical protein
MKKLVLCFLAGFGFITISIAQQGLPTKQQRAALSTLVDKYAQAREKRDTVLLRNILLPDVDQLVSSGEWRDGIRSSIQGMLNSSASAPGTRTLKVDRIRMLSTTVAVVDCRYIIQDTSGRPRNMWSTFIAVSDKDNWKIGAIRNMLPAGQ